MRLGVPVLLFAAVLALLAVGEQAQRARASAGRQEPSVLAGQQAPAPDAVLPDLAAMDRELDRMLARMNAAEGQEKLEIMAEVINVMARERSELREALAAMQEQVTAAAAQGGP